MCERWTHDWIRKRASLLVAIVLNTIVIVCAKSATANHSIYSAIVDKSKKLIARRPRQVHASCGETRAYWWFRRKATQCCSREYAKPREKETNIIEILAPMHYVRVCVCCTTNGHRPIRPDSIYVCVGHNTAEQPNMLCKK